MCTRVLISFLMLLAASGIAWPQETIESFTTKFTSAVKADNFAEQQELVSKNSDVAQASFLNMESQWCALPTETEDEKKRSEEYFNYLTQLATIYKIVPPRNDFLTKRCAWLQQLSTEQKTAKSELYTAVGTNFQKYDSAMKSRAEAEVIAARPGYLAMVEKATGATDWYWAAQAYWCLGRLEAIIPNWFDSVYYLKRGADVGNRGHTQAEIAKLGLDIDVKRNSTTGKIKADLVDPSLSLEEARAKYNAAIEAVTTGAAANPGAADGGAKPAGDAAKGGSGKGADAAGAPPNPNAHKTPMDWVDVETKVVAGPTEYSFRLPFLPASTPYWFYWLRVEVGRGSTTGVPMMPSDCDLENDSGKLFLHPGGKGKAKNPIRLKAPNKPEIMEFKDVTYPDGSTGTIWHVVQAYPTNYKINGYSFRDNGDKARVVYHGATVAKGKLNEHEFSIVDLNGNGLFNDFGRDCILTGKGKTQKVQPLSKYILIDGLMYEMQPEANGKKARFKSYTGPLALLKFEFTAMVMPEYMIGVGTGDDANYYFNLMDGLHAPMWVLPGAHSFHEGFFHEGKGEATQVLQVNRGRSGSTNVAVGELNTWKMGGAGEKGFNFLFKMEADKESGQEIIRIPGKEVFIYGSFGEQYINSTYGAVLPTVFVRKGNDGKPVITEKMKKAETSDTEKDWGFVFAPKNLEVKKTFAGDHSVRLEAEFRPLGKIVSDWVSGN